MSVVATIASCAFCVRAVYLPGLDQTVQAFLFAIAFFSEPTKILANRVLWNVTAHWFSRGFALVWYGCCVALSVALMHLLVAGDLNKTQNKADDAAAVRAAKIAEADAAVERCREDLRGVDAELEEARSKVRPIKRTEADLLDLLARRQYRNGVEKRQLEDDLAQVRLNIQTEAKIARLSGKRSEFENNLEKSMTERSRVNDERSENVNAPDVRNVLNVQNNLSVLAIAFAILLESLISGGIWADLHAARRRAGEPALNSVQIAERSSFTANERTLNVRPPNKAVVFEEWLRRKWQTERGKDGWLEGTQHEWAASSGVSSGFVHGQLKRLELEGKIRKQTSARRTWVSFVQKPALKIAK